MMAKILMSSIMVSVLLLVAGLFATFLVAGVVQADGPNQKGKAETFSKEALVRDLTKKGFQVSEGYPQQYTFKDCI